VNNYVVNAEIKNRHGIDSAFVFWSTDTSLGYSRITMTNSSGNNWTASIPHQSGGKTVYYYIRTRTETGKYFSKPMTAPRGHWKFNVGTIVGITENNELSPVEFTLRQNYPNPFNPYTVIGYKISKYSNIRIEVYNMLGQTIDVLVNENKSAGEHEITWDAAKYSSGMYIYSMFINGERMDTRRMMLIK
jgi:hypothetical protein